MNEGPPWEEIAGSALQIRKIGNSVGLILPKELLARLRLKEGDLLYVVEQTERGSSSVLTIQNTPKRWNSRAGRSGNMLTLTKPLRNERATLARGQHRHRFPR